MSNPYTEAAKRWRGEHRGPFPWGVFAIVVGLLALLGALILVSIWMWGISDVQRGQLNGVSRDDPITGAIVENYLEALASALAAMILSVAAIVAGLFCLAGLADLVEAINRQWRKRA